MMRHRRIVIALAGSLAIGGSALTAVAATNGGQKPAPTASNTPAERPAMLRGNVTTVDSRELEAMRERQRAAYPVQDASLYFAVLRRDRRNGDALPPDREPAVALGTIDSKDTRRVHSSDLGSVFAVPTDREVCVSTTYANGRSAGGTDVCVPTGEAAKEGVFTITQCSDPMVHPQRRYIAGVVPDGVTEVRFSRAGTPRHVASVASNGFVAEIDEPVDTVELVGTTTTIGLPPVAC